MKRIKRMMTVLLVLTVFITNAMQVFGLEVEAPSVVLMEAGTAKVIYEVC